MPDYIFRCDCGYRAEQFLSFSEKLPTLCPSCGDGRTFGQAFGEYRQTHHVRGVNTLGQLAEANSRRMGKEMVERTLDEQAARGAGWQGPVPDGARLMAKQKAATPPWRDGSWGTPKMERPLDLGRVSDTRKYVETGAL